MKSIQESMVNNIAELRSKGIRMYQLAQHLRMSRANFYRKLKRPGLFTLDEYQWADELNQSKEENAG